MMTSHRLEVTHESHAGQVRRHVVEAARRMGADDSAEGKAAIIATELATNLVKHGGGGEILVNELKERCPPQLEIHALDRGPGMENVSQCLRDGFSTAGSAGTGMGAVQRLADKFQIQSQPGRGTAVWVCISIPGPVPPPREQPAFETGGISVALKGEELCGDSWDVQQSSAGMRALVADGLGHGPFAEEAAREAVTVFRRHRMAGPAQSLEYIHEALFKTRGAAASMVEIQPSLGHITTAGIGNVAVRLLGLDSSKTLAGDNGTLGASVRKVREMRQPWEPGSLLVIHSDGINSQWNLKDYPGLIHRHPALIAGVIYRDFRRPHDDATVVAIKHHS